MKTETKKLNWNGLTDKEQELTESIINRDVFTLCNELVTYASENDDYVEFTNEYIEEEEIGSMVLFAAGCFDCY